MNLGRQAKTCINHYSDNEKLWILEFKEARKKQHNLVGREAAPGKAKYDLPWGKVEQNSFNYWKKILLSKQIKN